MLESEGHGLRTDIQGEGCLLSQTEPVSSQTDADFPKAVLVIFQCITTNGPGPPILTSIDTTLRALRFGVISKQLLTNMIFVST